MFVKKPSPSGENVTEEGARWMVVTMKTSLGPRVLVRPGLEQLRLRHYPYFARPPCLILRFRQRTGSRLAK